jgi:hypothetical protein
LKHHLPNRAARRRRNQIQALSSLPGRPDFEKDLRVPHGGDGPLSYLSRRRALRHLDREVQQITGYAIVRDAPAPCRPCTGLTSPRLPAITAVSLPGRRVSAVTRQSMNGRGEGSRKGVRRCATVWTRGSSPRVTVCLSRVRASNGAYRPTRTIGPSDRHSVEPRRSTAHYQFAIRL